MITAIKNCPTEIESVRIGTQWKLKGGVLTDNDFWLGNWVVITEPDGGIHRHHKIEGAEVISNEASV